MSWSRATVEINPASIGTGIKAALRKTKKSAAALSLIISETTIKKLEWSDKDGIEVMIGEGEHHGLIRLRKNRSVAQVALERRETAKGAWFSLKLGHQSLFVDRSESALWCKWEKVEDGWVEIILPKWADETGPAKARNAPPKIPLTARGPVPVSGTKKVSVTAAIMGDPEPGRREAVEKIGRDSA